MRGLTFYWFLLGAQVRSQLEYRTSFAFQAVSVGLGNIAFFLGTVVLFQRFPTIAGWTLGDVAFLYGLGGAAFATADLICGGFDRLGPAIQSGEFDRVLTRPLGTFVQTLAGDFQLRRIGRIGQAVVILALAIGLADIEWNAAKVVVLISAYWSGVVLFSAVWVIGAAVTFWTIQTSEVTNVFTYGGSEMVEWPMPIYADWLRHFFTFVVPLAFVTYLPSLFILEHDDPLGLPSFLQLCAPLAAALFLAPALMAWRLGVRHYQSTGT